MIFKTMKRHTHVVDLHDILQLVRKYDMRLNPAKCFFRVQGGKFLGFMPNRIWFKLIHKSIWRSLIWGSPLTWRKCNNSQTPCLPVSLSLLHGWQSFPFLHFLEEEGEVRMNHWVWRGFHQGHWIPHITPILTRRNKDSTLFLYLSIT